ncbi:MAG: hypothetical protein ACTSUC_15040 [Promethearchaeota archaeon]
MGIKLITMLIFIAFFTIICISFTVYIIREKIKERGKSISKIREQKTVVFYCPETHEKRYFHFDFDKFPPYGIVMLILLGLVWIGIFINLIYLIVIGGFRDDSWFLFIILCELFVVGLNIYPIVGWGYRGFAKNFAKGTLLTILSMSIFNGLRGLGMVEPPINYNLLSAKTLMILLTIILPWLYILMWFFEILYEKRIMDDAKKDCLIDFTKLPTAYPPLPDKLVNRLKELRESGNKEMYYEYLDLIFQLVSEIENNNYKKESPK